MLINKTHILVVGTNSELLMCIKTFTTNHLLNCAILDEF